MNEQVGNQGRSANALSYTQESREDQLVVILSELLDGLSGNIIQRHKSERKARKRLEEIENARKAH